MMYKYNKTINKEKENFKRNEKEILELKSIIIQFKKKITRGINRRFNQAEKKELANLKIKQ